MTNARRGWGGCRGIRPSPAAVAASSGHARRQAAALAAALGVVLALLPLAPASAATAYRFWSYWWWTGGGWTFATTGPVHVPPDGAVEGWRFAVSPAASSSSPPRARGDFAGICGSTPAHAGRKRVAIVVDYGTSSAAPAGQAPPRTSPRGFCAVLPPSGNGYAALAAGAAIRADDSGLVCGIDGYPSGECGAAVTTSGQASTSPTARPRPGTPAARAPARPAATAPAAATTPATAPRRAPHATPTSGTSTGTVPAATPSRTTAPAAGHATSPAALATAPGPRPGAAAPTGTSSDLPLAVGATARPSQPGQSRTEWPGLALAAVMITGLALAALRTAKRRRELG